MGRTRKELSDTSFQMVTSKLNPRVAEPESVAPP